MVAATSVSIEQTQVAESRAAVPVRVRWQMRRHSTSSQVTSLKDFYARLTSNCMQVATCAIVGYWFKSPDNYFLFFPLQNTIVVDSIVLSMETGDQSTEMSQILSSALKHLVTYLPVVVYSDCAMSTGFGLLDRLAVKLCWRDNILVCASS